MNQADSTGSDRAARTLVIVPCGRAKIWDRAPAAGPTAASAAYTGYPFRTNVEYAERFADHWLILSAKYGFIEPDFVIPGPYDVSFKLNRSEPISISALQRQARQRQLAAWDTIIGLGGRHYREALSAALRGTEATLQFPFAGLPLGKMINRTRSAIDSGDSGLLRRS